MATTQVIYNGVTITNCLTREFSQRAEYDASGTDLLFHRFTISVNGYISLTAAIPTTAGITPGTGSTTADREKVVRRLLEHPRGDFYMSIGGATILEARSAVSGQSQSSGLSIFMDVNNGPKPLNFQILRVTGGRLLEVQFTIEVCIVDCADLQNQSGVLSNRWSVGDEYDADIYCTRSYRGTLRLIGANINPHSFRGWVMPPLQAGFRRDRISMVASVDGLTLDYEISDRQVHSAAPAPATQWAASQEESTADGVNTFTSFSIKMSGPPSADKTVMIANALRIVLWRLGEPPGSIVQPVNQKWILESANIIENIAGSDIEVRATFRRLVDSPAEIFTTDTAMLGKPLDSNIIPNYDPRFSLTPATFGEASPAGLFIAYLQSPCNDNHRMPYSASPPTEESKQLPRSTGTPKVYTYTGSIPTDANVRKSYNEEHRQFMYSFYQIDSKYETNELKLQLPIAASSTSNGDTATVVRLANPVTRRVIRIAAERLGPAGTWPKIPKAVSISVGGLNMTLLSYTVLPKAPTLQADGKTYLHSINCEYIYGLNRPPTAAEQLRVGSLPWDSTTIGQNSVSSGSLADGIV